MKNMLVAQSGGPSAAINATITGVIDAGLASSRVEHVYGALNGIKGVLNENFVMLDDICRSPETRDLLAVTPAAALHIFAGGDPGGGAGALPLETEKSGRRQERV